MSERTFVTVKHGGDLIHRTNDCTGVMIQQETTAYSTSTKKEIERGNEVKR
jgi:hypothetical protein